MEPDRRPAPSHDDAEDLRRQLVEVARSERELRMIVGDLHDQLLGRDRDFLISSVRRERAAREQAELDALYFRQESAGAHVRIKELERQRVTLGRRIARSLRRRLGR